MKIANLKKLFYATIAAGALLMPASSRAWTTPLPLMVNSSVVIVGPTNAFYFFRSNATELVNALINFGYANGGGATNAVIALNGISNYVTAAVNLIPSNTVAFVLTTNAQTLTWNFAYNTNWQTLAQVQAFGTTASNVFATYNQFTNAGATMSNVFATYNQFTNAGATMSNTFATSVQLGNAGVATTNAIGAWTNYNRIIDLADTNNPFLKANWLILSSLNVASNVSGGGFHFSIDTGGNLSSDGTAVFSNNVTAPNVFLSGGRGALLPANNGTVTNLITVPLTSFSQRWYDTNGNLIGFVNTNGLLFNRIYITGDGASFTNEGITRLISDTYLDGTTVANGSFTFSNGVNMRGLNFGNAGVLIVSSDGDVTTTHLTPIDATAYGIAFAMTNASDVHLTSIAAGDILLWDAVHRYFTNGVSVSGAATNATLLNSISGPGTLTFTNVAGASNGIRGIVVSGSNLIISNCFDSTSYATMIALGNATNALDASALNRNTVPDARLGSNLARTNNGVVLAIQVNSAVISNSIVRLTNTDGSVTFGASGNAVTVSASAQPSAGGNGEINVANGSGGWRDANILYNTASETLFSPTGANIQFDDGGGYPAFGDLSEGVGIYATPGNLRIRDDTTGTSIVLDDTGNVGINANSMTISSGVTVSGNAEVQGALNLTGNTLRTDNPFAASGWTNNTGSRATCNLSFKFDSTSANAKLKLTLTNYSTLYGKSWTNAPTSGTGATITNRISNITLGSLEACLLQTLSGTVTLLESEATQ